MKKQALKSTLIALASVVLLSGSALAGVIGPPVSAVPEPTTILLFGTGIVALAGFARRKKK
ncbi:MAG: PEP-CTERM sorting domain-containing protein [Desulfobulbus sp.]